MYTIFLFIFILYIYTQMLKIFKNEHVDKNKLNTLFEIQNFHDIKNNTSLPGITLIYANSHGENYMFAQKSNFSHFSMMDINIIYNEAQIEHIHNIIVLSSFNTLSINVLEKIKEYDIKVWDENKINFLISSPSTHSILSTSNTSDDTCEIDTNPFDPIQKPSSFLKNIFKKPDRL